jgi:hypothetical protein
MLYAFKFIESVKVVTGRHINRVDEDTAVFFTGKMARNDLTAM